VTLTRSTLASQGSLLNAVIGSTLGLQGLLDRLRKAGQCAESNYTIIAVDFASRYCISRENNANTRPNLKTDTRLVGIRI